MSLAYLVLLQQVLLCAYHQDEDDIQSSEVLLLAAAIAAIRFDMLKIQQNALVALQRYLHNNNGNKSTKASVNQEEREHEINAMFRLSKLLFLSLVCKLLPWLDVGQDRNQKQNIPAAVKARKAIYYMAHSGSS
jgi:hypothetical protein